MTEIAPPADRRRARRAHRRARARARRRLRRGLLRAARRLRPRRRRVARRARAARRRARRRRARDSRRDDLLRPRRRARRGGPRARGRRGGGRGCGGERSRAAGASEPAGAARSQDIETPPADVPAERKADLLRTCDETARAAGAEVAQVMASYAEGRRRVTVANSERRASRATTARGCAWACRWSRGETGRVETGFETLGRPSRLRAGRRPARPSAIAERAAQVALTLLDADPAPAGAMPVVVGGGFGGVLFHEMTGHGLEADHIQKGASVYTGKLGDRSPAPTSSAYDDGRLPGRVGDRRDRRRGNALPSEPPSSTRAGSPPTSTTSCGRARTGSTRPATAGARASATSRSRG